MVAAIAPGREASLRKLLDSMNLSPGVVDEANALIPFTAFEKLHFARLALLDDSSMDDLEAFALPRPVLPTYLLFAGDCDCDAETQLAELVERAGEGLRRIFWHCKGFDMRDGLLEWLVAHDRPVGAPYVNWIGRTVRQIHEESALQRALSARARSIGDDDRLRTDPQAARRVLVAFVSAEQAGGRLPLTPPAPTPFGWGVRNLLHLVGLPLIGLLLLPLILLFLPLFAAMLRRHEKNDTEFCPRPYAGAVRAMQELEDHDPSNSFTALGPVKLGRFRRGLVTVLLVLIDYACRHVFGRGHLGRVRTIHFAHWVFLDNKTRVLFLSNYDGSHESYMDDFINKVAWGLNLIFSNGLGWPRTRWLLFGGARRELPFKYYQRGHQLPTQVWYKAYPGLTLADIARNQRIRNGLGEITVSDAQAIAWLKLL